MKKFNIPAYLVLGTAVLFWPEFILSAMLLVFIVLIVGVLITPPILRNFGR